MDPPSPHRTISVDHMESLVEPMNSSFSARLNVWPSNARTWFNTSKCSGSLSMSTPSMSNMMASKRPAVTESAEDQSDRQHQGGAGAGQDDQERAGARMAVL